MKASIKFRENHQNPLLRAKVPLNILGFPFQSGIEGGDTKELCLSFSTFFESGPLIKLSYRPNDSWNPFSVGLKTGIGHFGSPISAPMTMIAQFNLLGHGNPSFFLHFRPQIGDFSIRRSLQSQIALPAQSSVFVSEKPKINHVNEVESEKEGGVDGDVTPLGPGGNWIANVISTGKKINGFSAASAIDCLFSCVEVSARTSLPLRDSAMLKFRWSVKLPADEIGSRTTEISIPKMPHLVLSKIGIEHVTVKQVQQRKSDVADTRLAVKKELDSLQTESSLLRKGLYELQSEIGAGKCSPVVGGHVFGKVKEEERNDGKKRNKERK